MYLTVYKLIKNIASVGYIFVHFLFTSLIGFHAVAACIHVLPCVFNKKVTGSIEFDF